MTVLNLSACGCGLQFEKLPPFLFLPAYIDQGKSMDFNL